MYRLLLFLLLSISFKSYACESNMIPVSMQQKMNSSDIIVRGEVISKTSYWNQNNTLIYTDNKVIVDGIFKGSSADTITIRTVGGTVGNMQLTTSGLIEYNAGEYGIFFCEALPNGKYTTYSSKQGFLRYNDGRYLAYCPFYEKNVDLLEMDLVTEFSSQVSFTIPNYGGALLQSTSNEISFFPNVITAGTGHVLTITGSGFGTTGPSATELVRFPNADDGGAPSYYEPPLANYLTWTDTLIEIIVPTTAGTGPIEVDINGTVTASQEDLIIPYSIINLNDSHIPQLYDNNGSGGRTWVMNVSLFGADGQTYFEYAMNEWKCATGVNWDVGPNASFIGGAGLDGTDLVYYGPVPAGVLGTCHTFSSSCGPSDSYIVEQDIVFSNVANWYWGNGPTPSNQFDFVSTALHELGHAHVLDHVVEGADVMYFGSSMGSAQQTLEPYNVVAGNYVMDLCTSTAVCATQPHVQVFGSGCSHPNVTDVWMLNSNGLPDDSTCIGISPIHFSFGNYGADEVTSIDFQWSMNGTPQPPINWTGSLSTGDVVQEAFLGNYNVGDSTYNLMIWASNVNGGTDFIGANDTILVTFTPVSCTPDDAAVAFVSQFDSLGCYAAEDINVSLINDGENDLTSCWIYIADTSGTIDSMFWTGTLNPGATALLTITNYDAFGINNELTVWTESPNGVQDTYTTNDTSIYQFPLYRLNGIYTVGGTNPDFPSPYEAFKHLSDYGTCGDVVLNIRPGLYESAHEIQFVNHSSPSNTVLVQSETQDADDVILKYVPTPGVGAATFLLDGATNVTVKHITFDRDNLTGTIFFAPNIFIGRGSKNIQIDSCKFDNTQTGVANIEIESARYDQTFIENVLITNNLFVDGNRGIFSEANLMDTLDGIGLGIFNNTFDNVTQEDIFLLDYTDVEIGYNYFRHTGTFTSSSVRSAMNVTHTGEDTLFIHHNTILGYSSRPVEILSPSGSGSAPLIYQNNSFSLINAGNGNYSLFDLTDIRNVELVNNSFYARSAQGVNSAQVHFLGTNVLDSFIVQNNQFVFDGAGYFMRYYNSNGLDHLNSNYNNFHNIAPTFFVRGPSSYEPDMVTYQINTGQDANSLGFDPVFFNDSLLLPTEVDFINDMGIPWPGITDDIQLQPRSTTTPDIGSHEFEKLDYDIVMLPNSNLAGAAVCGGVGTDMFVEIKNNGSQTVDSFEVYVDFNSVFFDTVTVYETILPGASSNVLIGNYAFTDLTTNVALSADFPNGVEDSIFLNNSFGFQVFTKLGGIYTIGGPTADFTTIGSALNSLAAGICDSVTFNINPGYYSFGTFGPISGNTNNTAIIFQSAIPDTNNVYINTSTIQMEANQIRNLTFRNLNFENNFQYSGFRLKSDTNVVVEKCHFEQCDLITDISTQFSENIIVKNSSFELCRLDLEDCDQVEIDSNYFQGNNANLRLEDCSNADVTRNTFNSIHYNATLGSILIWDTENYMIAQNRVKTNRHAIGLDWSGNNGIIKNNFLITGDMGVKSENSNGIKVYNNSIVSQEMALELIGTSQLDIKNNIMRVEGAGFPFIYSSTGLQPNNVTSDYNLFSGVVPSSSFATVGGNSVSLSVWQNTLLDDLNSVFGTPVFAGPNDLHTNSPIADSAGIPLTEVQIDIDGQLRDLTHPDIGADEYLVDFSLLNDIVLDSLISPNGELCQLQDSIIVSVTNNLDTNLVSFEYGWWINGSGPFTNTWNGSLAPGQSVEVWLGNFAFASGSTYLIDVSISLPNNLIDELPSNNSISANYFGFNPVEIFGDTIVCSGENIELISSVSSADQSLLWSTSETTDTILVGTQGTVWLEATDVHGCVTTDSIDITVAPTPPQASILGDSVICENGSLVLTADPILSGNSYFWNVTNQDTSAVTITGPVFAYLEITNQAGCTSSATLQVQMSQINATFTVIDSLLQSDIIGASYQWYLNGQPIPSATQSTYTATQNGNYKLEVTDIYGCSDQSSTTWIDLNSIGLKENEAPTFELFPNPSSKQVTLVLPEGNTHSITLYDMQGKVVKAVLDASAEFTVSIEELVPGVYAVSVSELGIKRFVKIP